MSDPRVPRLAELLVNYSLDVQPGQQVRIDAATVAAPLVTELYRYVLRAGAHPRTRIDVEGLDVIAVAEVVGVITAITVAVSSHLHLLARSPTVAALRRVGRRRVRLVQPCLSIPNITPIGKQKFRY